MNIAKFLSKPVLTVGLLLLSNQAFSCSCVYGGIFAEYSKSFPVVVRVEISSYGESLKGTFGPPGTIPPIGSMKVEVTDVLKGNIDGNELTLSGDTGALCSIYITRSRFPIGSDHLVVLPASKTHQFLPGCGESIILINGSRVNGIDIGKRPVSPYEMDLQEIIDSINN